MTIKRLISALFVVFFVSWSGVAMGDTTCPAGSYCPAGSTEPILCPENHYCPQGSTAPNACPENSSTNGATGMQYCTCDTGYSVGGNVSTSTTTTTTACLINKYSVVYWGSATPSGAPLHVGSLTYGGTYTMWEGPTYDDKKVNVWINQSNGKTYNPGSTLTVDEFTTPSLMVYPAYTCKAGYYGNGTTCTACPANSSTNGQTGQASCTCNVGYTITGSAGGGTTTTTTACQAVRYSIVYWETYGSGGAPSKTASFTAADPHTVWEGPTYDTKEVAYWQNVNSSSKTYVPGSVLGPADFSGVSSISVKAVFRCKAGYYGNGTTCTACPANMYCPAGASYPRSCPSNSTVSADAGSCTCNAGYSVGGDKTTTTTTGAACVANTYTVTYIVANSTENRIETATYGAQYTISSTPVEKEGHVQTGWKNTAPYQPSYTMGQTITYDLTYNLMLSPIYICAAGYYGDGVTCTICPAGSYCPENVTTPTTCPAGSYCPQGATEPIAVPAPVFTVTTTDMPAETVFSFAINAPGTYYIDWGDGSPIELNTGTGEITHTFENGGVNTIGIAGGATGQEAYPTSVISFTGNSNIASLGGSLGALFPTVGENAPAFLNAFQGCTNLTTIPSTLFSGVTKSADNQFYGTFQGCTSLTSIPDGLFADLDDDAATWQFVFTFADCSGLTGSIPADLFSGVKSTANGLFLATFSGCSGLTGSIPATLFATVQGDAKDDMFSGTFKNCTGLTGSIPADLFSGVKSTAKSLFVNTFYGCSGLTGSIPATLFATVQGEAKSNMFNYTFANCPGLTGEIPAGLFSGVTSTADGLFNGTFSGCSGLTGEIPSTLFATIQGDAKNYMFTATFADCSGLTGSIPADLFSGVTSTANNLFQSTFANCSGLTGSIPATLFATVNGDAKQDIFRQTFGGCSKLSGEIPADLFSTITGAPQENSFYHTFYGASGLTGTVPTTLFATLYNADYASGPMSGIFNNTGLATACPVGTYQYTTGFEVDFDGKVACAPCPAGYYCPGGTANPIEFEPKFTVTTTNMPAGTVFEFAINATGTYYIDWGDGSPIETITSPGPITHTFADGGVNTIGIAGGATGQTAYPYSVISFAGNSNIASLGGSLGALFPTVGENAPAFQNAFYGCTNLTTIPSTLFSGVTKSAKSQFANTFRSCSGLKSIPDGLFADLNDDGAESQFGFTFDGCSGLTGSIPADLFSGVTSTAQSLFYGTFEGCSGLTGPIPATLFATVKGDAKQSMFSYTFNGCTGLTGSIPADLFSGVTSTADWLFNSTFNGCSGLTGEIPATLFETIKGDAKQNIFRQTFSDCSKLSGEIPAGLFSGVTSTAEGLFQSTFSGCTGLTGSIPATLFATIQGDAKDYMFDNTFSGCKGLTGSIPADLFSSITSTADSLFSYTFSGCTGLTGSIPATLFATIQGDAKDYMFQGTFNSCTGLTGSIPADLFSTITGAPQENSFYQTFNGCRGLTGPVPATLFATLDSTGYTSGPMKNVFYNTGLATACPAGEYQYITGFEVDLGGKVACTTCTAGSYCPEGVIEPILCPENTFCPEGVTEPIDCPENSYSYEGAEFCICDDGYTTDGTDFGATETTGEACLSTATRVTYYPSMVFENEVVVDVPSGEDHIVLYSEEAFPDRVANGYVFEHWAYVNNDAQVFNPGDVVSAAELLDFNNAGGLSVYGVWHCAAGYYGDGITCTACPAGYYCPQGTANPIEFEPEFSVTTTDMPAGTVFEFAINATGTYYIDWGDGSPIEEITSPGPITHTFENGGVNTIGLLGEATGGYSYSTDKPGAIVFRNNLNVASVGGSLGDIFPSFGETAPIFGSMFRDCTNLTTIPSTLFSGVTKSANYQFSNTFSGCTSLTSIPDGLFADLDDDAATSQFQSTFNGCTGLTGSIPAGLFAGVKGNMVGFGMFQSTFANCSGLTGSIPADLFGGLDGNGARSGFESTFSGCSGLTGSIPATLFSGVKSTAESLFSGTFWGCKGLNGSIPSDLFASLNGSAPANKLFQTTFNSCSGLTGEIPEDLFASVQGEATSGLFYGTFAGCSGLTGSIPAGLFRTISGPIQARMFYATFQSCSKLSGEIPADLFSTFTGKPQSQSFLQTFYGCRGLTGTVPTTLFETLDNTDYASGPMSGIFLNTGLATACPAGEYQYMTGFEVDLGGKVACTTCTAGYYCPEGSITPTLCPEHSTSIEGSASCKCDDGYNADGAATTTGAACVENTYTVTLDANGGTGGSTSVITTYNAAMPTATMPTRAGYTFTGYYDAKTDGTQYYNETGNSVHAWDKMVAATLYARWTANEYVVKFNANGGSGVMSDQNRVYDDGGKLPANTFTRTGYTFAGWNTVANGSGINYADQATGNLTDVASAEVILYAQWTVDTFVCVAGTYLKKGEFSCSQCEAGYYCAGGTYGYNDGIDQGIAECVGNGEYSAAGASSCTTVDAGYYTTGCNSSGNLCTGQNQCGAGNYCVAGVQNSCASGLTTIGYGTGADEAEDCGIILHAGGGNLYLRSGKKTEHALHVRKGGQVFYGSMSTNSKNMNVNIDKKLKVKYNNTTYFVHDDSVQ